MGNFANAGRKQWHSGNGLWGSGNGLWGLENGLWLAIGLSTRKSHYRPPQDVVQGKRGKVGAFPPLAGMQEAKTLSWLRGKLR